VYPGDRFRVLGVRRFLRLVIDEGVPEPTSQDRIRLLIREESYTTRAEVPFRVLEAGYAAGSNERWSETLELTGPARLITRLDVRGLRPGTGKYSIAVEARLPEGIWSDLYAGDPTGWTEGKMDSLVVEPVRASAIRLQVQGADAPNAPFEVVRVLATPQSWRFEAEPGTDYWLGYGDPFAVLSASVPLVEPIASARVSVARLGPPEANPFFQEPGFGLEWLRRRPAVLTVVMAAILLAVAWLTLRGRAHARTEH
jgi:hypothetical protein